MTTNAIPLSRDEIATHMQRGRLTARLRMTAFAILAAAEQAKERSVQMKQALRLIYQRGILTEGYVYAGDLDEGEALLSQLREVNHGCAQ